MSFFPYLFIHSPHLILFLPSFFLFLHLPIFVSSSENKQNKTERKSKPTIKTVGQNIAKQNNMKQNSTKQNKSNNNSKAMYFILCRSATPVHGICPDIPIQLKKKKT